MQIIVINKTNKKCYQTRLDLYQIICSLFCDMLLYYSNAQFEIGVNAMNMMTASRSIPCSVRDFIITNANTVS